MVFTQNLSPSEILSYMIIIVAGVALLLFIGFLFLNTRATIETNEMERFEIELYENIAGSNLTDYRFVFNAAKLDSFDMTRREPYVRHCSYAYNMKVEASVPDFKCSNDNDCSYFCQGVCGIGQNSLIYSSAAGGNCYCSGSDTCSCFKNGRWMKKPQWEVGFSPDTYAGTADDKTSSITRTFPAAISIIDTEKKGLGYEDVVPAKVTLTVYDYWISRILCIAESAQEQRKKVEMWIPCIKPKSRTLLIGKKEYFECGFPIRKKDGDSNSKEVCLFERWTLLNVMYKTDTEECRETNVSLFEFSHVYSLSNSNISGDTGVRILKALPIKAASMDAFNLMANGKESPEVCNNLAKPPYNNLVADGEPVGIVVLCLAHPASVTGG